jgi:dimethylargininase
LDANPITISKAIQGYVMTIALTRSISPAMARCELTHVQRSEIDLARAEHQHRQYQQALRALGCQVIELPAEPDLPDSVFVEDVAVVLDEVAIVTRPGAESRRAESASVAAVLARHRKLMPLTAPATLDGGDVLRLGRVLLVGASGRSNAEGVAQLQAAIAAFGYTVRQLPIRGCLHLKSAVTEVAEGVLLVQPEWLDATAVAGFRIIEVDPGEPHAANALRVGSGLIYPSCFPLTLQRLRAVGIEPVLVDVSELQKAEGAVTCCSLLIR